MAISDNRSLPIAVHLESATPHEVTLVEATIEKKHVDAGIERLIGDRAFDADALDTRLEKKDIELIAPHRSNRKNPTQDGRPLRRYLRRWNIERLFAWLQNYRKLVVRYEYYAENFLAFVQLGCIIILLRQFH